MDLEKIHFMKEVAIDYYINNLRQNQIAKKHNMSTSMVSRLLDEVKAEQYVKFKFDFPTISDKELSNKLMKKYDLDYVFVAPESSNNLNLVFDDLVLGLGDYLLNIVEHNHNIGVSWGKTMFQLSERLRIKKELENVSVYQLHGGVSNIKTDTKSFDIVRNFGNVLNAEWFTLPVPSIVDSSEIASVLYQDSSVREVTEMYEKLDVALFSVGTMSENEMGVKAGYFTKEEFAELRSEGYVGDICSRYYDREGNHPNKKLYERIMGIDLETIKKIEHRICVTVDFRKEESIRSAINSGLISSLFIDHRTAKLLIENN